jgi:catechol 2,3-dioxygenase-like lactoylglutathione lyase family enzyme
VILGIDHVQVAGPPGCEAAARAFYGGLLRLEEVQKPSALAARGGCWFQAGEQQLHVGIAEPFAPSTKAHPALRVASSEALLALRARIVGAGIEVTMAPDGEIQGVTRCHVHDPFGNRVEIVAPA